MSRYQFPDPFHRSCSRLDCRLHGAQLALDPNYHHAATGVLG
jgi:hypothetical protein